MGAIDLKTKPPTPKKRGPPNSRGKVKKGKSQDSSDESIMDSPSPNVDSSMVDATPMRHQPKRSKRMDISYGELDGGDDPDSPLDEKVIKFESDL